MPRSPTTDVVQAPTQPAFPGSPRRPARRPDDLGQHMTPLTVARQMVTLVRRPVSDWRAFDPACGDGNLLIAAAERMLDSGISDVAGRIGGTDIDPAMVKLARQRLADVLRVEPTRVNITQSDFLAQTGAALFAWRELDLREYNLLLSNPPYGRGREYDFFRQCAGGMIKGAELIFLMPLSFLDRVEGPLCVPLDGRPLGVTTGHAIVRHVCGDPYRVRPVKENQANRSDFVVLSGLKLYELGAGTPPQTEEVVHAKPYSSVEPRPGWLPCVRTGDIHPNRYVTGRLFVSYGPQLAHPKDLERFSGPRLFVRRVPIWQDRQLGAVYLEDVVLCAGDVLVVRHREDDPELLKGLCHFLNSPEAAEAVLAHRPSVRFRDSFPKLSAKDINLLLDQRAPDATALRRLARSRTNYATEHVPPSQRRLPSTLSRYIDRAFPVGAVSEACAREKSIRQGHISTLQLWWARRPLAVCRAAILAALLPDPEECGDSQWISEANRLLPGDGSVSDRLGRFIASIATWKASNDTHLLNSARRLLRAAYAHTPVVLDTFAGGGSFPLEALRLDLDAIAGELNPVAVVALTTALAGLPVSGEPVVEAFEAACDCLSRALSGVAARLYGESTTESVLACFWCRTYRCAHCGAQVPLLRDYILSDDPHRVAVTLHYKGMEFSFSVNAAPSEQDWRRAARGTVTSRGAACPHCSAMTSTTVLQELGRAGRIGEQLYALRVKDANGSTRYRAVAKADRIRADTARLRSVASRQTQSVPDEPLDPNGIRHTWAAQYGVVSTGTLFNRRQSVALLEVLHEMRCAAAVIATERRLSPEDAAILRYLLACMLNRLVMYNSRHSWWQSTGEFPANMFGRQAIPFVWNYVEMPFSSNGAGGVSSASQWVSKVARHCVQLPRRGRAYQGDAARCPLPDKSVDLVTIDPPYYDSIAYSYLADVFYVWMREFLRDNVSELFAAPLSPKAEEAIVDRRHRLAPSPKGDDHFRRKMATSFSEVVRVLRPEGRAVVMFGHKKAAAWDAVMAALLESGLYPIASWPVHTERKVKFRHGHIAALSSSCLMVCRVRQGRPEKSIEWSAFVNEHQTELCATLQRYRSYRLYGSDLLAALVAPLLSLVGRYLSITEGGRAIRPTGILERLSSLAAAIYATEVLPRGVLSGERDARQWLERLWKSPDAERVIEGTSPLLTTARGFAAALDDGAGGRADEWWHSLSSDGQQGLLAFFEAVSVMASPGSRLTQVADTCLGRISLLQRAQGE